MNIVTIAQIIGVVSILLLFSLKFYIVVIDSAWHKSGRIAMLWTCIYVFFLFFLRLFALFELATTSQLRVISGFTSLIPLIAVVVHLFLVKKQEHDRVV